MLVSIFRLTHSTKGDDKAGGCITKRFHRKRIEWNTFDTPPPTRWPKSRYVYLRLPSQFLRFPVGSRLLPRIYADYALWNRATIRILFGFRMKERGREWICESEFLPSLELITRSLRRFIVSLLERSGREREKVFWFRISCIFLNARNGSRLERLTFFLISYSFRLNECKYIMRAKG